MNSYLPIYQQELSSQSYQEKSMRMHRRSQLGKGEIFWLSLALRTSAEGKFFSSRDRNCNLYLSDTGDGFCSWLLSMSRSEKIGRSMNSPADYQMIELVIQSVRRSTCGELRGGEDSSIQQISRNTCWVFIIWFCSSACCCRRSYSLIITLRPRSAIYSASQISQGCALRNLLSYQSVNYRSLLQPSELRSMWILGSGSLSLYLDKREGICLGLSSVLLPASSSMMMSLSKSGLLQRMPQTEREMGKSQPSFLASVTASFVNLKAALQPLEMSYLVLSIRAFSSEYLPWMAANLERKTSWSMDLDSRSRLSLRISSIYLFLSRSSLSLSISSMCQSCTLPQRNFLSCPVLSKELRGLTGLAAALECCYIWDYQKKRALSERFLRSFRPYFSTFSTFSTASTACSVFSTVLSSLAASPCVRQFLCALRVLSFPLLSCLGSE